MIDRKMQELIDFLETKNMDRKIITRVINYQYYNPTFDITSNTKFVYEIFGFINLKDKEIERLIKGKMSLLKESKLELCKIAYVFKEANLGDFVFEMSSVLEKVKVYKRIFMRHIMSKNIGISPTALMVEPKKVYAEHRLSEVIHSAHNVWIDSDEELEQYLNTKLTYNGEPIDVDKYIELNAKLLYSNYLNSKRNKKKNKGTK